MAVTRVADLGPYRRETEDRRRAERRTLMKWLVKFLNDGAEALTPAGCRAADVKLRELTAACFGMNGVLPTAWMRVLGRGSRRERLRRLRPSEVRVIHQRLCEVFEELRPFDPAKQETVPYVSVPAEIESVYLTVRGARIESLRAAAWPALLWLAIVATLEEFGPQIIRCSAPSCRRLLLRTGRRKFCSLACAQQVRSSTWYEANREEAKRRRREAYARDVRKTHPKAKIRAL